MSHRYSTAFSHIILAGTGFYCLSRYHSDQFKFPSGTFLIILSNSIFGAVYWGSEDYGYKLQKPYHFTTFLQNVCAFPFVVTQVLLNNSYQQEVAHLPAVASMVPLVMQVLTLRNSSGDLNDLLIAVNAVTLGAVSVLHENYWGLACAITFAFNHFYVREGNVDFENLPVLDLYNYSLIFFCLFTLRTV